MQIPACIKTCYLLSLQEWPKNFADINFHTEIFITLTQT